MLDKMISKFKRRLGWQHLPGWAKVLLVLEVLVGVGLVGGMVWVVWG